MRNRFFLCIAVVCVLAVNVRADQPTVGGDPAFATEADVKLSTIRNLIEAKEYASAEKLAVQVTDESPDVVDGWLMLGYTRTLNGKFEESNVAYDTALDYGADRKEVFTLKAYNCRKLGDALRTRECYRIILEEDANNIEVMMQLGNFEIQIEAYDEAVRVFNDVLVAQPDHYEAIDALSRAEEKLGNAAQVKYWLEKGLSYHANDPKLLRRLSLVYLNEQNYTLAIHYLGKLITADRENAAAYRNLGIAHYQQGDKRKAKDAFEKVRELGGKMDGLYGPLADCFRSINRPGDAMMVIKEGLSAGSQAAWLYSVWGKIFEDNKNYDQAIAKFNKAVALQDEPWSGYARKQIARQSQLKKRAAMIAAQGGME